MTEKYDHLGNYIFTKEEVVTVGGNPNVLAEVIDTSDLQIKVRILTPPNQGRYLYTTRYTYYTKPMPHLTPKDVTEKVNQMLNNRVPIEKTDISFNKEDVFKEEVDTVFQANDIQQSLTIEEESPEEQKEEMNLLEETELVLEQMSLF